jgi:hypothetical protein
VECNFSQNFLVFSTNRKQKSVGFERLGLSENRESFAKNCISSLEEEIKISLTTAQNQFLSRQAKKQASP